MKNTLNHIFKEASRNYKTIVDTHKMLEKTFERKIQIHSAGQWLLDNMYIIEEEYEGIKEAKKSLKNKKLPTIKTHDGDKHISIFYLAYELVEQNTGYLDQNIILNCLKEHQKLSYLTSEELDLFMLMLKIALIKFIARICLNITNSQIKKLQVEEILSIEVETGNISKELYNEIKYFSNFKSVITNDEHIKTTNTAFVEYMAYRLKELGQKGDKYYNILEQEADKIGFTIEEAIIKEHMEIAKTTEYIGRAILAYKQLKGINFREIFEKVNKADETLKDDYTNEFKFCDYKTKARYRSYIIKLAKKYKFSEVYVAKKAVECSHKYKKHVGFFLVGEDKYLLKKELGKPYLYDKFTLKLSQRTKSLVYIMCILIISFELSLLLYSRGITYFENQIFTILAFIFSFIFNMEIVEKILNYCIRKTMRPEILPRFDFAKTVSPKYPTYVVMPTIISSIEKLDAMINKMEVTYLANRSENIYYMLVGDCMSSDKKHIDLDDKIVKYAREKLDALNKKYPSKNILFNFMYRKRIYSKSEECFMGWERKRGALLQFNNIILGKYSKEQINNIVTLIYDNIVKAKYAITIDEDTQLSLNTAKDLVSIIAHPLNQPVLSKNRKIVEKGYGLIQPSVGLDVEAANKSIFSKIFGGFGGLDIYTTAVSNTYQDVFGEAIFCGKGIYNIELFEELVSKEIPENLVLSHDLLEGSIIRCGLASDIELQDGFPNNYIAYMRRNHRWYRGDMQIIRWLLSPKSKLNILSKWKIFDNIRRPMLDVFALAALLLSLFTSTQLFMTVAVVAFFVINFGHVLSIIDMLIFGKIRHTKELQYIPIIHGIQADLLTMCFNFITMPYRAYMCLSAFLTSLYRMIISKKHLLEWTTAEVLEKTSKDNLGYYYFKMLINVITGVLIILAPNVGNLITFGATQFKIYIGISFIVAPVFSYLLGKDHLLGLRPKLNKKQEEEVLDIAKRTWNFFDTMMNEVNNYLPTDNYQETRRYKIANRTSSTNIGFAMLSIIDAYDLKFITVEEVIDRLQKIFATVNKLDKWNGHLYNWYNIKTLEPLRPRFISTVDSGNFIACLYVVKEFLKELNPNEIFTLSSTKQFENVISSMVENIEKIIKDTDFTVLYDTSRNLFTVGYDQESSKLADSYYDMLMSESRTTSLIAIATRQVTSKHWFALGRNLVKLDGYKGCMSWTGTSFEYFMPYLFNKSYEHTLIDQSLFFARYSQMKYAKTNNVPWGISESAYAVKDGELNYQYKAFGIPWLGLKRGLNDSLVISPYASLLMLEFAPQKVYKNIQALKKLGAYSTYGFYESIDYTKEHLDSNLDREVMKTYMAHHQGMILSAINNYINNGVIKERFHRNPDIRACEILLKEREKMVARIKKKSKTPDNKFKQKNVEKYTTFVNCDYVEREFTQNEGFRQDLQIALLKGSEISTIITNNGASFLKYRDKIINRQRYTDIANSGNYVYLTDKVTGKVINATDCNILSNTNKDMNKVIWTSNLNSVECYLENDDIETTTTIFLSPEKSMEIKKISMYNNSNVRREILINTLLEPAMTDYMTNVVHPSFSNLQIETYYDSELDALIASKRKKTEEDTDLYVYSKLIGIDLEKEMETEKNKIIKDKLNAYNETIVRYPLWTVLSYRATIILDPYERQSFYYVVGICDSKYKLNNAIVSLDKRGILSQYKLNSQLNSVVSRYLKLEPGKANVYNNIIKDSLFSKAKIDDDKYWNASLSQSLLWKYSISGDLPIILIYVEKIEEAIIVKEAIKFMDYVKNRGIDLDIVFIINEKQKENGPIYTYIKQNIDRAIFMNSSRGNIYILNKNILNDDEILVLSFLSKKYITNISDFLTEEEKSNIMIEDMNQNSLEDEEDNYKEEELDENNR